MTLTIEQISADGMTEGLADALARGERIGAPVFAALSADCGLSPGVIGRALARRGMELDFDDATDDWLARPCAESMPEPVRPDDATVEALATALCDPRFSPAAKDELRVAVEALVRLAGLACGDGGRV